MTRSFQPVLGASVILFISSAAAYAEDTDQSLPPVVVSATRLPTPEDQIGSSVTVISGDEIERKQERTLPDALQDAPGLNVVQEGGPGGQTAVFIRGTNSNHTKILLDGIDVSDPSSPSGAFDFSHLLTSPLLTSDVERVEVLRGPQSGLYGSDAIGGVINIITRPGSGPAQFTGSAEAGSYDTFNQTAGVSGSLDRFNYALNLEHFDTGATPVTPSSLVVPGRPRNPDSYDNKTIATRLGANLTDNFDVGLVARVVDSTLDATSDDFTGPEALPSHSDNLAVFTRGTAHWVTFGGAFSQTAGLAYTDYHRREEDDNAGAFTPMSVFNGDRIKGDWQGDIKLTEGQTLTLGAEHQLESIDEPGVVSADMGNTAGDIQLQSAFGERLFNTISLREDDNDRFGSHGTYRVAPAFLIPETGTRLKASLGTGFKAPTLDQLFESFPAFGFNANPNLKPETSVGYDVGFEQSLPGKKVQFGSTYFHNDIKNLINPNAAFTTNVNVGQASTHGFENFVAYKPWKVLTLRADYTFTVAEDDIAHQELLRRPKNKASLNAAWQASDRLQLSGTVLYTGSWVDGNRDFSIPRLNTGSYTLLNFSGSYDLGNGLTAFGRIDNALDKRYEDPIGFQHQGFGIFGGLKIAVDTGNGRL